METAEEFLNANWRGEGLKLNVNELMIEFAKMHVQAALKAVIEKAEMSDIDRPKDYYEEDGNAISKILNKNIFACEGHYHVALDDESVYESYPLTNIK